MLDSYAKKTSTREKILAATRHLMSEKGVQATTLADISQAAGISQGTLFYYYKSKDDLIYDIVEQHFSQLTDSIIASIPRRSSSDKVTLLRGTLEKLIKDQDTSRMNMYLLQEAMAGNSEIKDRFMVKYQTWREMIARQVSCLFAINDPEDLAGLGAVILAIIDGLTIQYLLDNQSFDFKKAAGIMSGMLDNISSPAKETP
ncbi:MAG: TetR/AcrR family transcriptional regulator [Syntrophomonadaceae bacterium]|nr:TetR/AcrR family transcriptional regulator [Syntrophomonadaceae bacterium]